MIDILVPTLGRHRALEPLAVNIINTTAPGGFRVIFVADEGDKETQRVLDKLCFPGGVWDRLIQDGTYPEKIDAAYRFGRSDLVAPVADDVVFHDGWLEAALNRFDDPSVQVLGTDDLSPATVNRDHATMPILRRSYCESPGAAWGLPDSLFYTGYKHNYCETETWALAHHRGVTGWAEKCVIEHLHPAWDQREVDDTDRKGNLQNFEADERLFRSRRREWMHS